MLSMKQRTTLYYGISSDANKKKAFSLGETLIAIGVLGIIFAILIPLVMALLHDRVRESHVNLFKKKFLKSMEMMALQGEVGPYYRNTQEFVDYLQGHLKINAVCRVGSEPASLPPISDCWGDDYPGITLPNDTILDIDKIETGDAFQMPSNSKNDWSTHNIAILTIDGNHMILSYNLQCEALVAGVYSGDIPAKCVAGVMDVDGIRTPNKLGKDVAIFANANGLGPTCYISHDGLCLSAPKRVSAPATHSECIQKAGELGYDEGKCMNADNDENYFVPMAEECGGWANIASPQQVKKVIDYMYDEGVPSNGSKTDIEYIGHADILGLPNPSKQSVILLNHTNTCNTVEGRIECKISAQKLSKTSVESIVEDATSSGIMESYFFCNKSGG